MSIHGQDIHSIQQHLLSLTSDDYTVSRDVENTFLLDYDVDFNSDCKPKPGSRSILTPTPHSCTQPMLPWPPQKKQKQNGTWRRGRRCGWLAPAQIVGNRDRGRCRSKSEMPCHAGWTDTGRQSDDDMGLSVSCVLPAPTPSISSKTLYHHHHHHKIDYHHYYHNYISNTAHCRVTHH